jgi:hypothetical protein
VHVFVCTFQGLCSPGCVCCIDMLAREGLCSPGCHVGLSSPGCELYGAQLCVLFCVQRTAKSKICVLLFAVFAKSGVMSMKLCTYAPTLA